MAQTIDLGNVIGPQGPIGPKGAAGGIGPAGAKGADGATWLFGTSAPATTQGKTGDFYINTSNYDVYSKASGNWVKTGNIKGATGNVGGTGPQGPIGPAGPRGATGGTGPQGPIGPAATFTINAAGHLIATYA